MDEQLKRRLIGAIVLVSLAIIFLPMLLEHKPAVEEAGPPLQPIPQEPKRDFDPALLQDAPPRAAPVTAGPAPREEAVAPPAAPVARKPAPAKGSGSPAAGAAPGPAPAKAREESARTTTRAETAPPKAAPAPPAAPSGWVVQVASLSSRDSAMKLVKKLRRAGLDTMDPRAVTVKGKRFYRVQVGPEISKANAEKHLSLIQRVAGTRGKVMRYP